MKEPSIEEKSHRYDEVIERANSLLNSSQLGNTWIYKLLPELKESNNEKIIQFLIHEVKETSDKIMSYRGMNKEAVLTWLEKQGKKTEPIEGFDTEFERQISHIIASTINKEYEYTEDSVKRVSNALLNYAKHEFEKQGEQKPADKIDPKFKVGNWIIKNDDSSINIDYSCCKITKVENGNYTIESIYGHKGYNTFEIFEKDYHLWTIEDAKAGDVLVRDIYPSGPSIYIFKEFIRQTFTMKVHCSINNKGQFLHNHDVYYYDYDTTLHPATKEQKVLLFQKMKEAGYMWDADEKELYLNWRPSEKQLKTLEKWLSDTRYDGDSRYVWPIFDSLYKDLKKLAK